MVFRNEVESIAKPKPKVQAKRFAGLWPFFPGGFIAVLRWQYGGKHNVNGNETAKNRDGGLGLGKLIYLEKRTCMGMGSGAD